MRRLLALLVLLVALAACGGDDERTSGDLTPEEIARIDEETSTLPGLEDAGAGLGESAPAPLRAGWETDFSRHSVPLSEITSGGPGKDGIPAIDEPRFIPVSEAAFLDSRDPVIAVAVGGEARAYPLEILLWHEIVNDRVGDTPVAVTFCPLCNTAIVFDRRVGGETLDFGTTGNLRHSDLVMYDRQTESWWQQFSGTGIVGRYTDVELELVPSRVVSFKAFREEHPGGQVLDRETGHDRPYGQNPYPGYDETGSKPFFPVPRADDDRLEPKERVVFLRDGDDAVAVSHSALRRRGEIAFELGGERHVARWEAGVASALDEQEVDEGRDIGSAEVRVGGRLVPFSEPFWFAVAAFSPDVRIVR